MHRRMLLAALGTPGAASATGCLGSSIFNTPCDPGDRALGPLYDSVLGGSNPGTVSVRGTIVSVSGSELVIADGTGFAAIEAQFGTEFNTDLLETGDCIEVTSAVAASFSREYGHLSVRVDEEDEFEPVGSTDNPPEAPPNEPDVSFDVQFVDGGVKLRHTGNEPVPAKHIEVRSRPETNLEILPWEEFAGVSADTQVTEGDSAMVAKPGHLIWRPVTHWGRAVSSSWKV